MGKINKSMASIFAEAGAKVLINSRTKERSDALVSRLKAEGLSAESAVFDVTSPMEIASFTERLQGEPLHILVNNAYVGGAGDSIECADSDAYAASYDVTMITAHRLLKAMLPNLRLAAEECGDASIINLASMYALVCPDHRIYKSESAVNPPFYGAAKAALVTMDTLCRLRVRKRMYTRKCDFSWPIPVTSSTIVSSPVMTCFFGTYL